MKIEDKTVNKLNIQTIVRIAEVSGTFIEKLIKQL